MRNFFLNLFYFILFPTILFVVTEISISLLKDKILSEQNLELIFKDEAKEYNWLKQVNSDSLVLLAGSSSVRYGLSCGDLNQLSPKHLKYINIAFDSRDPILTYFLLKNLDTKRVASIYFGLDPWIYAKRYYKYKHHYLYLDFNLIDLFKYAFEHDKSAFSKRYKVFWYYLFPKLNKSEIINNMKIPADFGSVAIKGKPKNFNDPIDSYFQLEKYGWSKLQFIYLKKLSEICKKKNIKFCVFVPPKHSDYNAVYKKKCRIIHSEFVSNISDVGFKSPIFGKYDMLENIESDTIFSDAFHLNEKGQKLYSSIFYYQTQEQMTIFSKSYSWFKNYNFQDKDNSAK